MGFKKFINSLKNFGDTFLGRVKRGLIFLERDNPKDETDEKD